MRSVRDQNLLLQVMGITQAEPRDAERFEEGSDSDFQDAVEVTTRETDTGDRTEQRPVGLGNSTGDSVAPLYENAFRWYCCPC